MCRILCEGLETMDGITDAVECFHQTESELTEEALAQDEAQWVRGKQSDVVLVVLATIIL